MAAPSPTNHAASANAYGSTRDLAFPSTPTVGSVLCCVVWTPGSGVDPADFAVSDDRNGSWGSPLQRVGVNDLDPLGSHYVVGCGIWTVVATSALTTTVTVARGAGSKYYAFNIFEISGAASASPVESSAKGAGSSTSPSVDCANTVATESVVIGAVRSGDATTIAPAASWTELWENENLEDPDDTMLGGASIIYRQATSAGQAYDPAWTFGTSRAWGGVGVIVAAPAAGSSPSSLCLLGVG